MSTVSEKSEYLEYSAMGSALSKSYKSRGGTSVHHQYRSSHNELNNMHGTLLSVDLTKEVQAEGNIDVGRVPKVHTLSESAERINHNSSGMHYSHEVYGVPKT